MTGKSVAEGPHTKGPEEDPEPHQRHPLRILHLEDNPADARFVGLMMEGSESPLHAEVRVVSNKRSFLTALREHSPDLILCDYRLPGYDGDEALKAVKEICPEVPVIMVTGELGEERAIETLKAGAADYVLKDGLKRLVPSIRRALKEASLQRARLDAERALSESEERFRTLADNIPQLAWMTDEKGWIFWYNKRWFDYTGTNLAEMEGWGWQKVHHPEHVGRVTEKFREALAIGLSWEDTFPLRGKDGRYRWFLSRAFPIRNAEGKVVRWFGTNTDITEHVESEALLRRAVENMHLMVEASSRPMMVVNGDGTVESVNGLGAHFLGYQRSELEGRSVLDLAIPFSRMEMMGRLQELAKSAPLPVSTTVRAKRKDGMTEWFAVEASLVNVGRGGEKYLIRFGKVELTREP